MAYNRGIIVLRSSRTWSMGPPIVASSRYQTFSGDVTERAKLSTARAKMAGPVGSLVGRLYTTKASCFLLYINNNNYYYFVS